MGTATVTYDANGNMLSSGTDGYTWDARNHLVSTLSGASFKYDPFGRRVSKTISGTTTTHLYDGLNSVQEISGGTPTANLITGLNLDERFLRTDSAGARNFLTDPLGSTTALADSTGTIQTSYAYEPFGNTSLTGQPSANPYQYTGREDDGTGLYFYRARYYNPMFGRFVSQDPIGLAGGVNPYAYVGDNPANYVDPSGLDKKRPKENPEERPRTEGPFQKVAHALNGEPPPPPNCMPINAAAVAVNVPAGATALEDAAIATGRGEAAGEEAAAAAATGTSKAEAGASEVAKALIPAAALGEALSALAGCR